MLVNAWRLKYKKIKPKKKIFDKYRDRNAKLIGLGYSTYQEYLASDDWKIIRKRMMDAYPTCHCCPKETQVIHHMSYSYRVMLGLMDVMLVPLCHQCHEKVEITPEGAKRDMHEANGTLYGMAIANGKRDWVEFILEEHIKANEKDRKEAEQHERKLKRKQEEKRKANAAANKIRMEQNIAAKAAGRAKQAAEQEAARLRKHGPK